MHAPAGAMDALVGAVLDRKYRLERPLGRGGMGAVFLATHFGTERPVALKVIAPEHAARPEFVERFRREARSLGRLRHPNVVDVTDFGITDHAGAALPYLENLWRTVGLLLLALPAAFGSPLPAFGRGLGGLGFMLLIVAWVVAIAANGALCEPLGTILEHYERVALPETAWPRLLRDRLVHDITSLRTRGEP